MYKIDVGIVNTKSISDQLKKHLRAVSRMKFSIYLHFKQEILEAQRLRELAERAKREEEERRLKEEQEAKNAESELEVKNSFVIVITT